MTIYWPATEGEALKRIHAQDTERRRRSESERDRRREIERGRESDDE